MNSVIYNFCTHTWSTYCVINKDGREGERMCLLLDENYTTGVNVKVLKGGRVSKRVKCYTGTICHSMGRGMSWNSGKNVREWMFCHNPGKKGWSFCHSYIMSTVGAGWTYNLWMFCLDTKCHSERSKHRILHWVGVLWVLKCYKDVSSLDISSRHPIANIPSVSWDM
jgi:hypothetical protein